MAQQTAPDGGSRRRATLLRLGGGALALVATGVVGSAVLADDPDVAPAASPSLSPAPVVTSAAPRASGPRPTLPPGDAPSPPGAAAPTATRPPAAAPAQPLAGAVVALDPGHNRDNGDHEQTRQPVDAGGFSKECNTTGTAARDGYTESRFNWELAQRVAARLGGLGAQVRMTRERDAGWGPCIDERGRFGALSGADLLLSLHADGSTAPGDAGFHVIRPAGRPGWTDDIEQPSARLASVLRESLLAAGFRPSNYRGVDGIDVRDDLGTLNWADVPAVVLETHNMRDAREAALFRSRAGQERVAAAVTDAVVRYLRRP